MVKLYSQDLRDRLERALEPVEGQAGHSRRKAARGFDVSASRVIKLMRPWQTTGDCGPRRSHQWRTVPGLRCAGSGADLVAWRNRGDG
jgi:transposase